MRRVIYIYPPCCNIRLLNLRFMVWRKLPEFFFRILERFNFYFDVCICRAIRGVNNSSASVMSASTTTTANANTKATTTSKYSLTAKSCSYCVDPKCIILGIVFTCPYCNIFVLAKIINEQIVEFI